MATFSTMMKTGTVIALLLAGIATGAHGVVGVTSDPYSVSGGWGVQLRGHIICARCSLVEVRQGQPDNHHLYQLTHRRGQVVMEVTRVHNSPWWHHLTVPRLRVRGEDGLFEQLTAEENLLKEVEITGILSPAQVLDLSSVTIRG